mgnify:FL=1
MNFHFVHVEQAIELNWARVTFTTLSQVLCDNLKLLAWRFVYWLNMLMISGQIEEGVYNRISRFSFS